MTNPFDIPVVNNTLQYSVTLPDGTVVPIDYTLFQTGQELPTNITLPDGTVVPIDFIEKNTTAPTTVILPDGTVVPVNSTMKKDGVFELEDIFKMKDQTLFLY